MANKQIESRQKFAQEHNCEFILIQDYKEEIKVGDILSTNCYPTEVIHITRTKNCGVLSDGGVDTIIGELYYKGQIKNSINAIQIRKDNLSDIIDFELKRKVVGIFKMNENSTMKEYLEIEEKKQFPELFKVFVNEKEYLELLNLSFEKGISWRGGATYIPTYDLQSECLFFGSDGIWKSSKTWGETNESKVPVVLFKDVINELNKR